MIKAVIWDVGGVLIQNPEIDRLWQNKKDSLKLRDEFGIGKIGIKEFVEKGSQILVLNKRVFLQKYQEYYSVASRNEKVIRIYKNHKGERYIFSDTNPIRELLIKQKTRDIYKLAKQVFLSHKIKMRKNDLNTYRFIIKNIGLHPQEILLIDDKESNIQIAQDVGLQTLLFENAETLQKQLAKFKLITT